MVAINFSVFQDKILSGEKRQTVRLKARCKPGDRLQLYTGMRTKACRKLGEAVCEAVFPVLIGEWRARDIRFPHPEYGSVIRYCETDGRADKMADRFARADGFTCWEACAAFFREKYGLPFAGQVIVWRDFHQEAEDVTA